MQDIIKTYSNYTEILISFLNDTLKPKKKIVSVDIKKTDIEKQYIEDKYSRLDVKATTSNDEIINIEIQLKNENNMVKRSLYYLSKMYEEQLNEKEDYSKLARTVCINILNFKYIFIKKVWNNRRCIGFIHFISGNSVSFIQGNSKIYRTN